MRYEESIKIPLLLRVPWLAHSGTRVPGNMSLVDLVPTLLDLMGQPPGPQVQGQSRADVLRGTADLSKNDVVVPWYGDGDDHYWKSMTSFSDAEIRLATFGQWRTLITPDRWKLTLCQDDVCELFDLAADPHEQRNLFDDPGQQARIQELAGRLMQWQRLSGDTLALPAVGPAGGS